MLLQIVKTVRGQTNQPGRPAPLFPPDHYGCGLGCGCFTGTLAVVEEHERGCIHFLEPLLPEGLDHDICNGDEDEHALTLREIVEPLQHPLSVLQKERRVKLASLSLVVSDKMLQLESTNRHPATSQKLQMSTQSTLPAAPASAPLLPSDLIVPIPLSLNLLHKTPLHSTQTGDSNLVTNTTVDSSHEEKVPRQQGQDIDRPLSFLPLPVNGSGQPLISPEMMQKIRKHTPVSPSLVASNEMSPLASADRHTAPSQKLLTSQQPTQHAAPALAPSLSSDLITHSPQSLNLVSQNLLDRTQTGDSNLVHIPTIDNSYRAKVLIDEVGEEAVLEGQNTPFDMDFCRSRDSNRKEKVQQQQGQDIGRVKFGGQSHAVAGDFTRPLGVCVEDEVSHSGLRVQVEVFASFGMLPRQPFLASCNHSRHCHPLLEHVG